MSLLQAFLLGVLQGATEFLPVSSSGHLVLVPWLLQWENPGLVFDAVVHWGTAAAVIVYFWQDWLELGDGLIEAFRERSWNRPGARLAGWIVLGTIPAALVGYLLEDFFEQMFARPLAAAGFLFVTAGLLTLSEWIGSRERDLETMSWLDALIVGGAQALAIFPGISRSGATMAAGLQRGLKRESAARFSFLLATPVILGAGLLKVVDLIQVGGLVAQAPSLVVGFAGALVVGFGCIYFLLRYLREHRLYVFAAYCAVFGVFCIVLALTGMR